MDQKIQRMKELIEILREASRAYYAQDKEIMSNYEYDKLYDELSDLEQETGMVLTGSPTISVGYEAVDELQEKSSINNVLTLSNWNLTIDSYEPGEKVTRTEENEDTGVTTTEAAYLEAGWTYHRFNIS